jgi:hypothetical protein
MCYDERPATSDAAVPPSPAVLAASEAAAPVTMPGYQSMKEGPEKNPGLFRVRSSAVGEPQIRPLPPHLQPQTQPRAVQSADAEPDPLRIHCFSFDWSGWSNNAALFLRQWWLHNLDDAAILTRDGNGMCVDLQYSASCCSLTRCNFSTPTFHRFEVNAMMRCRKKGAQAGGVGKSLPPHVCQLFNGIVNHEEIDQ